MKYAAAMALAMFAVACSQPAITNHGVGQFECGTTDRATVRITEPTEIRYWHDDATWELSAEVDGQTVTAHYKPSYPGEVCTVRT